MNGLNSDVYITQNGGTDWMSMWQTDSTVNKKKILYSQDELSITICQYRLPTSKPNELKHLLTDQTGNKKTYCQGESGNYRKTIWQYRSPRARSTEIIVGVIDQLFKNAMHAAYHYSTLVLR